jgi:hypothetical protein
MKKTLLLSFALFVAIFATAQKLPFQGKLIESGNPVNEPKTLEFGLPDLGWTETHTNVQVTDGLYFVVLGSINPLPENLFSGADERQLTLSVEGTPLSPVTLYKPLAAEQKELNLQGPGNGLLRAGFGTGSSLNENQPSLTMKGNLEGNRLALNVVGNNEGTVEGASINMNSTSGNITSIRTGSIYLSGSPGQASLLTSNEFWLFNEGNFNLQLFNQNWGNKGHAGTILLRGPSNNLLFEIGNRHWENAALPRILMRGSIDNPVIELSATNDENEAGFMNLHSRNGYGAFLNVWNFGLNANGKRTASVETQGYGDSKQKGVVILEDSDGNKSSFTPHHLSVNGTDWKEYVMIKGTNESDNTHGGYITLTGQDNKKAFINPEGISLNDASGGRGVSIRSTEYGSSSTQGLIELFGANSPDPYKRTGVLATGDWGDGDFGMLSLIGSHARAAFYDKSNAEKINLGIGDWGNGTFGQLHLRGEHSQVTVFNADGVHKGFFGVHGNDGKLRLAGDGAHIALEKELHSPNNHPIVFMDIENNGNGDFGRLILNGPNSYVALGLYGRLFSEGSSGHLELRGPTTQNFHIGSAGWENSDRPWMNMTGKDDKGKMTMTTIDDVNGERGIITLSNSNGTETTYANNGTWGTGPFNMWSGAMVSGTLTVNGNIQGSGTNSYNSDERLKKEIQPLSGTTLNKIESLGGYSYFWKKEEFPEKNFSTDQQIGLLAQELEAQFPALVKTGDDGFKSVNYNGFTAVLLEAVKELNAKVEKLESENRMLQAELSASVSQSAEMTELKNQVEFLTKLVQEKLTPSSSKQDNTANLSGKN